MGRTGWLWAWEESGVEPDLMSVAKGITSGYQPLGAMVASRAVFETSEALFDAALAKDPHYAAALAWRAYWHVLRVGQGWSPDPANDARLLAETALEALLHHH